MTSTEQKIFEIISKKKEKVHISVIAKEMAISPDYARLICQSLKRHGYIDIVGNYCTICKPAILKEEKRRPQKISKKNKKREGRGEDSLFNLKSVNKKIASVLKEAGYKNIDDIVCAPFSIFAQKTRLELSQAAKIFNEARKKIGIIQ